MVAWGQQLLTEKGCTACHTMDGTNLVGPTFKGIWGHNTEMADGSSVVVDENYIRESILKPNAKIVKGFKPLMPTFEGMVNEDEMSAIITLIKSLKE